jgi:hypothetical protein
MGVTGTDEAAWHGTDGQRAALRDVRDALQTLGAPVRERITLERMEMILREQCRLALWALNEIEREFRPAAAPPQGGQG